MNYKMTQFIKRTLVAGLFIGLSSFLAIPAQADMISIPGGVGGMPQYGSEYVGPIGAKLNGNAINGGIVCLDIFSTTYVPNSGFNVTVGTLSPLNMSQARFGNDATAISKYQEAAWLIGQMAQNPGQTGPISFAVWRLFSTVADTFGSNRNLTSENSWLSQASHINPQLYDFSSVKIYTPTGKDVSNQEFMSGKASPVPIPAPLWLLGSALLGIFGIRRRIMD